MRALLHAVLAVAMLSACSYGGFGTDAPDADRGGPPDGGPDTTTDGPFGPADGGLPPPAGYTDGLRAAGAGMGSPATFEDSCYGMCGAAGCGVVRSCCVGDGACCADVPSSPLPAIVDTSSCANGLTSACPALATATEFGTPAPSIFGGAVAPQGLDRDSGLFLGGVVDLEVHRLVMNATVHPPTGCTAADCVESVAIGVTAQEDVTGNVYPLAALVYSGTRSTMSLVLGDIVAMRWDGVTESDWQLELRPTGEVSVTPPAAIGARIDSTFRPAAAARVVIWGRTPNPGSSSTPTRLSNVRLDLELCDLPDTWGSRETLDVRESGSPVALTSAPSLATLAGRRLLAFETDGGIRIAEGSPAELRRFDVVADAMIGVGPEAWRMTSVSHPDIVYDDVAGTWVVFFEATGENEAGTPTVGIAIAELSADLATVVTAPTLVLYPGSTELSMFTSVHEPSVVIVRDEVGTRHWVMAVRGSRGGTASELAIFRSPDGRAWQIQVSYSEYPLATVSLRDPAMARSSFDADGVSSPSLLVHNGAWHLYYTGREGPRSGIGLFLSDELLGWRTVSTVSPVFGAGSAAWNDVGVVEGDVVSEGSVVEMVYGGYDGARTTLGRVGRLATDAGVMPPAGP